MQHEIKQMTLDVGGDREQTLVGSYSVSGALGALAELPKGADVRVVISNEDGEIISTSIGHVSQVAFKDHRKGDVVIFTERKHTVKLES